jgi:hypothetical protein
MERDIVTHFSRFSKINQKIFHESFITSNSIHWSDIDFNRSYVLQYSKRGPKEQFDLLKHTREIPYFEFFECTCGTKLHHKDSKRVFHPNLWHYDDWHFDVDCPFRWRCDYFKLIQSADKKLPLADRLINMNKKGSLMIIKKRFRYLKLDYEIFFRLKSFNSALTTSYKNESQLIQEFSRVILKRPKKPKRNLNRQAEETNKLDIEINSSINDRIKKLAVSASPEYHPQSPSFN